MTGNYYEHYSAACHNSDQLSQLNALRIDMEPSQSKELSSDLRSRMAEQSLTLARISRYGDPAEHCSAYPGVVTISNRQPLPVHGIRRVEVMGMIGAGKDNTIDSIALKNMPNISFVEEPAKHLLKTSSHMRTKICQVPGIRRKLESEVIAKDKLLSKGGTIVYNRGPLDDLPFSRAQFIHGLLPSDVFYEQFVGQEIPLPDAVIVMLVSPLVGLKRKLCQLGRKDEQYSELLNIASYSIRLSWRCCICNICA